MLKKYQLNVEAVHLDSSSFQVHGEYKNSGEDQTLTKSEVSKSASQKLFL